MKGRIIWNDLKENKLMSISTWTFMAVSALLFALTCFLYVNLTGAIDVLMEKAQTPDFLQMHAGEIDRTELEDFAERNEKVRKYQTAEFLNLENGMMILGGQLMSDSTQDNGVSVQNEMFDYLLNLENEIIHPEEGEIYVPVCYQQEYALEVGETMQIGKENFLIKGFLRDSQMNSMMASSKRFLVSQADYNKLKENGTEEYLIEFLLMDGADVDAFATEYGDAGLPGNGPAITRSLIRMMNALSDGLMILVILLVSVVMLGIAMLCIRFTLLARLEADRKEIGMLKAVGIGKRAIRQIYFGKFLVLSATGAIAGLAAAYLLSQPLQKEMQRLYGTAENDLGGVILSLLGVLFIEIILLCSVRRTLKSTERLSAVEALTGRERHRKNKKEHWRPMQYWRKQHMRYGENLQSSMAVIPALVIGAGVFMMMVPQNLQSTISSPGFVTYMGIGNGEIRLDVRPTEEFMQTEEIQQTTDCGLDSGLQSLEFIVQESTSQLEQALRKDKKVSQYAALVTKTYRVVLPDGSYSRLNVELGNHKVFPVAYAEGKAPVQKNEIALSYLCADEFGLTVGDSLKLFIDGTEQEYTVCGIYSDITNGGKTAKAAMIEDDASVMWSIFYVSLTDGVSKEEWIGEYENFLQKIGIGAKVVDIQNYVTATYGQTMERIRLASYAAVTVAVGVIFMVIMLFTRLIVAKERYDISLRKAIGFTGKEIKRTYAARYLPTAFGGVFLGIFLGNLFGESLAGMLLKSFGAAEFDFIIDFKTIYIIIPVIALTVVFAAVMSGLWEVKNVKAQECCAGKE